MGHQAIDESDRIMGPLRRILFKLVAPTRYFGTYEYAMVGNSGPTATGRCTDPSLGMPDLVTIPMVPAIDGTTATWTTPGQLFYVTFINGDPVRPRVVHGDPNNPAATITLVGGGDAVALASKVQLALNAVKVFAFAMQTVASFSSIDAAGAALYTALGSALPTPSTYQSVGSSKAACG